MATERLSMRKTREILRQKWQLGRSHREVAFSVAASAGVVANTVDRAARAGLDLDAVEAIEDDELERRLYPPAAVRSAARPLPDFAKLHAERTRPGVTLELLHLEYLDEQPGGYCCRAC